MMITHFPANAVDEPSEETSSFISATIESNVNNIITSTKVLWTIRSSLNPYKTAGTDGITPAFLQKVSPTHLQKLTVDEVHSGKMEENKSDHHPYKAEKTSHNQPKD